MEIEAHTALRPAGCLARHRRLLALCALSLLLHALAIVGVDAWIAPPPAPVVTPGLAVRLAEAPVTAAAPPALPAPVPVGSPDPSTPAAEPVTKTVAETVAEPVADVAPGAQPFQMPSRYRVAMPPAATIVYELQGPAGAAGEATLRWETDGVQYRMALDGILGRIESEGGTDDAGIAPQRASYRLGAGSAAVEFERARRTIVFAGVGRSAQDTPGSQDGATVLMQLAGIGLADPDQMQEAVEIYVGRADGAAVERFQVLGRVQLATPLGSMETVHLVRGGGERLEVWLAPQRGWLPVQLRATAPDGSVRTQVAKEITGAPPG